MNECTSVIYIVISNTAKEQTPLRKTLIMSRLFQAHGLASL